MNVSVCIATRGDIDMGPIVDSLPKEWEIIVWDNSGSLVHNTRSHVRWISAVPDVGAYGRFAAIKHATHDLILTQDDDVIVSDPQVIVHEWIANCKWRASLDGNGQQRRLVGGDYLSERMDGDHLVANMPAVFRPHYPDSAMVGFGACFHRDAPERAFAKFFAHHTTMKRNDPLFLRESCRIFTTLTPRVLVDVAKTDLPYASDPNRLWKQPGHILSRDTALRLAREVRDA